MSSRYTPLALLLVLCVSLASAEYCMPTGNNRCWPSQAAVSAWLRTLSRSAQVLSPYTGSQQEYLSAAAYNMNTLKASFPAFIVRATSESDIIRTVRFATQYRIRLVAKCSGHDLNGRSNGMGVIQLVTANLTNISYNNRTQVVSFDAGCNHGHVYGHLAQYGRVMAGGHSMTVCPAGCLSGGCHGAFARMYGLGIDSVTALRVVLYNGTVVTATASNTHSSLFHAMLGAGHSTFGIISRISVKTHPAPPAVFTLSVNYALPEDPAAPSMLEPFLQLDWWQNLPLGFTFSATYMNNFDMGLKFTYVGNSPDEVGVLAAQVAAWPGLSGFELKNYTTQVEYAVTEYESESYRWGRKIAFNYFVPPSQEVLSLVKTLVYDNPVPIGFQLFATYGGEAMRTSTVGSITPGMRNSLLEFTTFSAWLSPENDVSGAQTAQAIGEAVSGLTDIIFTNSYVNEWTNWGAVNSPADWRTRFYKNYSQLLATKRRYDPCNLYTVELGVGYERPTATCNK